jgi:hypothetical protein
MSTSELHERICAPYGMPTAAKFQLHPSLRNRLRRISIDEDGNVKVCTDHGTPDAAHSSPQPPRLPGLAGDHRIKRRCRSRHIHQ